MHAARTLQHNAPLQLAAFLLAGASFVTPSPSGASPTAGSPGDPAEARSLLDDLDAPLLFVKRHSYTGIHIYDTYYKWPPGGGGIYILENPQAPPEEHRIRPIVDASAPETPGAGVYSDPDLSWDATRIVFAFKGAPAGSTSIYEIGIDGRGLRRLTNPDGAGAEYHGRFGGHHDISPAYLPDGRIVFLSTRPSGLVPCNNTGSAILHVMNPDGSDIRPISANNVNEFDPCPLPDGRILFGRWEYVDKNALTIQSLWTIFPDGSGETALFANNMVFPEAILDARPIPGSHEIVATFAKHNGPPRGAIAVIDPVTSKNGSWAVTNLDKPEDPVWDRGDSCEPWPVSKDVFLYSGRAPGARRNAIFVADRKGRRTLVLEDPEICLHSPMLVKPRRLPPRVPERRQPGRATGFFYIRDVYRGLEGVERGSVKWIRIIEETSRTSPSPGSPNPYNQTFLVSAALTFSVKNFLGRVPVEDDGSAFFEVPAGKAVYFQLLDGQGRLVQSMRTFVQAVAGVTRSCIGCHEREFTAPPAGLPPGLALRHPPRRPEPESWGRGFLDYPSRVQPVLDRRCVRCHGGPEGIAAGIDLSGGWTEHFNISYENLANRAETQLTAYWIAGIDCMNGTAHWSARVFPPRAHGSGVAPLAELLTQGHGGRIPDLSRKERELLFAWIDTNGIYYGRWDYTRYGYALRAWRETRDALARAMAESGCVPCHGEKGRIEPFESDWFNLKRPRWSRILRAPLPPGSEGYGLGLCRNRRLKPSERRLKLLWNGYAHAVQPLEAFPRRPLLRRPGPGEPAVTFTSPSDPRYRRLLAIIREGRRKALATPRVDMPGAEVIRGTCRKLTAAGGRPPEGRQAGVPVSLSR